MEAVPSHQTVHLDLSADEGVNLKLPEGVLTTAGQ